MEPLKPQPGPDDFQTAAPEVVVPVPLGFRENSVLRDDVLEEQGAD